MQRAGKNYLNAMLLEWLAEAELDCKVDGGK